MALDLDAMKQRTRSIWSLGNYAEIARLIEPAAAELVRACSIDPDQQVLDVAAGNGNVGVLAARADARVVATDGTVAIDAEYLLVVAQKRR